MIDSKLSKPLYEQIKDYLLAGIQSGEFQPGARIPSERDLSERFNVSRLTANKAVKQLERAGIVYAQVGKGTFISPALYQQQLNHLTSFTDEMHSRGYGASSRVLSARMVEASDAVARILDIPPGARLCELRRVRMADNEPMALETTFVVAVVCPDLLGRFDFSRESLYKVLRNHYGITLTYAEQTLEARLPSREEAKLLGINHAQPILAMTRVAYTEEKSAVEYVQSSYRGDRYKFNVVLRN
ncbi:MAG: GntR family transcriptional regulator [Anaerolineae bacterium]|nr:GntR family transcriptional regulator [Anaerolineae bacterium]